jgi:chromosome segregation ATPase
LRQDLANTQSLLRMAEATRAEIAVDIAARRAQIVDLEVQLAQEIGEAKTLRDENISLDEWLTAADKDIIALESDLNSARQRLLVAEDEKRAQQGPLDKASGEAARLSRKLAEMEASLNASQSRLRQVEANFAELNTERARLARALEEANERHEHERANQRTRFEALQARASATERLLGEPRGHLLARAEEFRDCDRRMRGLTLERDTLRTRLADVDADRIHRDSTIEELTQQRATVLERTSVLTSAFTAKEAALEHAEDTIGALNERVATLEQALAAGKQTAADSNEELVARAAPRKARTRGGRRRAGYGAQGPGPGDARCHGAAAQTGRAGGERTAARRQRCLRHFAIRCRVAGPRARRCCLLGQARRPRRQLIYRKRESGRRASFSAIPSRGGRSASSCPMTPMKICHLPCATTCLSTHSPSIVKHLTTPIAPTPAKPTASSARI